jgi:uncharacterized NAD(P)/FAD-binding protein YdhS
VSESSDSTTLRVAIAGLGPKGLFALERLLDAAGTIDRPGAISIDVFEPHPTPGAGPVYDPAQPRFLLMNLAGAGVNAWRPESALVAPRERLALPEWQRKRGGDGPVEDYPPRAEVGVYLCECLELLLANCPRSAEVRIHRAAAIGLSATADGDWILRTNADDVAEFDEVLLSVGHQSGWPASLASTWRGSADLVPVVFPVARRLTGEAVPPGSTVAVRGFALTFLDGALALTEGRGGRFAPIGDGTLEYVPGGEEPAAILPFSRSGQPMLAKPEAALARGLPGLEAIADAGRRRILDLPEGFNPGSDLLPLIAETARSCLVEAGGPDPGDEALRWIELAAAGTPEPCRDPRAAIEQSIRVGSGLVAPDLPWALGHAWIAVFGALAPRLAGDALDAEGWPVFRNLADAMERLAFGPPPANARKLLALIDAGVVDLSLCAGGRLTETEDGTALQAPGAESRPVDVVVDAVLPGPGAEGSHLGLFREALEQGWARRVAGRRGIEVADDGSCIGSNGGPTQGLATIGRTTEDSVIDNDTLSRERHPHAELWARRVVARALASQRAEIVAS